MPVDTSRLEKSVQAACKEIDRLREALNQSCACTHDGRGGLAVECQEHQEIREQRDELFAVVKALQQLVPAENVENVRLCKVLEKSADIIARVETSLPA